MQTRTCAHSQLLLRGLFFRDTHEPSTPGCLDGSLEKKVMEGISVCACACTAQSQCNFSLKLCVSTTPTSRRSPIQASSDVLCMVFFLLPPQDASIQPEKLQAYRFTALSSIFPSTISSSLVFIVTNHKGTILEGQHNKEAPSLLEDASSLYELSLMPVPTHTDISTELLP